MPRPSYRSLFRTPEFTPLFLGGAAQSAAQTLGALALGTLVYRATGSPLLAAVSMFGPSLAQVLGATFLLSGADRLPRVRPCRRSDWPSRPVRRSRRCPACRRGPSWASYCCWVWSPRSGAGSAGGC